MQRGKSMMEPVKRFNSKMLVTNDLPTNLKINNTKLEKGKSIIANHGTDNSFLDCQDDSPADKKSSPRARFESFHGS